MLVVSHRYWQSRFAADSNIIGRVVRLNGFPFTVIGVAPPAFLGTELILSGDFWAPMTMASDLEPNNDWLHSRYAGNTWVVGRLKPGVSRAQAEADLDRITRDLARIYPDVFDPRDKFHLAPPGLIGQTLRKPVAGFGIVLTSIAGAGLLLACINLAGMLLARASDRHREIGIRLALGAARGQLLRQFLTESFLLSIVGGLFGFVLAFAACGFFSSWHPDLGIPLNTALRPNAVVLCFTLAISLGSTLLFGLAPALQAARTDVLPGMDNSFGSRRVRRWTIRDLLVSGQIALSVVLVISSVLVVRSLQHALTLNFGFNPANAVSISFDLRLRGYTPESARRFDSALLAKTSALPGIQFAGIINNFPLRADHGNNGVVTSGDRPLPPIPERPGATIYNISPAYLAAAGTRLLHGRDFNSFDRIGAPSVAIVNEALARALFPHENPLGRHVRMSLDSAEKGPQIVGVVETGQYEFLGEDPQPAVFLPVEQTGTTWTTLVARTRLPAQTATELLRNSALALNPDLSFTSVGGLKEQLALPLFPARIAAIVLGVFGVLAMVLAATGLFALVAFAVSRRSREIGIRMALGANAAQVLSAVVRRTVVLCAIGIILGVAISLSAARLLSAILYGVSPRDPATYTAACLIMLAVALLACSIPALRAIRIDSMRTLREQ